MPSAPSASSIEPSLLGPLCQALGLSPAPQRGSVLAFVGAGGKTSAIFALVRELRELRLIVTTTTRLRDPRLERDRPLDRVVLEASLADDTALRPAPHGLSARAGSGALVVGSGIEAGSGKLVGIHPSRVEALRAGCDFLLVEADGSRGLPVKAPRNGEPVLPDRADLVVGVMGLDCLGLPLGPQIAQRHEILGALVGCSLGEPLGPEHLLRLALSPSGLFKHAPACTRRAILLNKAEGVPRSLLSGLLEELAQALPGCIVLATSLRDGLGGLWP